MINVLRPIRFLLRPIIYGGNQSGKQEGETVRSLLKLQFMDTVGGKVFFFTDTINNWTDVQKILINGMLLKCNNIGVCFLAMLLNLKKTKP